MKAGQLILISAPSGTGKTSLVNAARQQDNNLVVSISHTTRTRRATETDGVNYHFVSPEKFETMIAAEKFLEHAQVFDHRYGTAKAQVDALRASGQDVILEIDWQGADQIRKVIPQVLSIFVLPPNIQILRARLLSRGQNSAASIESRLAEAQLEMDQAPRYQYIVVNDDFDQATADLLAIVRTHRLSSEVQIRDHEAVKAILSPP